jgi:hypothetical protein
MENRLHPERDKTYRLGMAGIILNAAIVIASLQINFPVIRPRAMA